MFLNILFCLVSCAFLWIWLKWRKVKNYWSQKNVPHSEPHLIFGSLTFLQKENPAIWLKQQYNKFLTPYFGIWLFWRPALVINSPEIARRVLVKDAENFRNRHLSSGKTDPLGSLNLFTVNDPIWSSTRRHLTTVFTAAKLRSYQSVAINKSRLLVERIANDNKNDVEIDLRTMFADYTTDVFGETGFGLVSDSITTGDSSLRYVTREFMKYDTFRGLAWCSIFFFPELVDLFGFRLFPKYVEEYIKKLFRLAVEQHGGYNKEVTSNRDLIDALLKMKQDAAKEGQEMSEDFLAAQATLFIQGAFDTSAVTLTYSIYELAHAPETQERVYQEIADTKQKLGDKNFDATVLSEMPHLNSVIKEVLRKYPPMGWLDRVATKSYKIDETLTIPAGTVVYVNAMGMQWDPQYFPEPEKFLPERFLQENEKNLTPFTFLPFGDGPRHCIGERFAYQTIRFALAELMAKYTFKKIPNSKKPSECSVEKKGLFLMPTEKMSVHFVPRN